MLGQADAPLPAWAVDPLPSLGQGPHDMGENPAEIALMISGRCNLSCAYCYLDGERAQGAIRWDTLVAALAPVLDGEPPKLTIELTGGEPLLAAGLLERAVGFVEERRRSGTKVEFSLTTNGTLLTPAILAFLFAHGFAIRISFDGVPAAQDLRGKGTFAVLDRLLDRLRSDFPRELRERVMVGMTLVAATIPQLSASVAYLVGKGAGRIGIGPRLTHDPDWTAASRHLLEAQVEEVVRSSVENWRRTGDVPVGFLGRPPLRDREAPVGEFLCGAPVGDSFCVGPDGRAFACPMLAESLAPLPPLALRAARATDLGPVDGAGFRRRLAALPRRAWAAGMFTDLRGKRSSYGRCAGCRFVADCHVCPASICHIPGNRDPGLVPDFVCAFNQVTLAARERLDELTGGELSEEWYRSVRLALRRVETALRRSTSTGRSERGGRRSQRPRLAPDRSG